VVGTVVAVVVSAAVLDELSPRLPVSPWVAGPPQAAMERAITA
jgi:hypothetical protein